MSGFTQHLIAGRGSFAAAWPGVAFLLALALAPGAARLSPRKEKRMKPITSHPENPHYFLFRGKPTVLITSGEHYGAVLNLDFDCVPYLDTLAADGLNLTRLFSGCYREVPGSFNIQGNTLAPAPGRFICPWPRTATPGASDGGGKFDLTRWDEAYFRRLRDFCAQAGKRGVVVEVVLFCPFYEDVLWQNDPMNAANNVNGVGAVPREEVYTLKHPDLMAVHTAMTRRIVQELKDLDNVYYEICNEPYFGGVTMEWQHRIADTIVAAEAALPNRHLIAQNVANGSAKVENPHPAVSLFNFHYASPPDAVGVNYGLGKAIGFNETGFAGNADATYRAQAWEFLLAGGSLFNNLDYSFTAGHERGTFRYPETQPGGGSPELRRQLRVLKEFLYRFDFVKMAPDNAVIKGGVPAGGAARALAEPGKAYAVYVRGSGRAELLLAVPAGRYRAEWVNTHTGAVEKAEGLQHAGGELRVAAPPYVEDIALRLVRATG